VSSTEVLETAGAVKILLLFSAPANLKNRSQLARKPITSKRLNKGYALNFMVSLSCQLRI
jgi:hypothetical protein